jgi:putative PIN family toxin of toxin-antitoxin system
MRVVVDTNVFVSAGFKATSVPAVAVQLAVRHGQLLKSASTEAELLQVLRRPKLAALIDPIYIEWIERSLAQAEAVEVMEPITGCRDPKDNRFLELAVNGRADLIITGDADLLAMNPFREIPIIAPALFVKLRLF